MHLHNNSDGMCPSPYLSFHEFKSAVSLVTVYVADAEHDIYFHVALVALCSWWRWLQKLQDICKILPVVALKDCFLLCYKSQHHPALVFVNMSIWLSSGFMALCDIVMARCCLRQWRKGAICVSVLYPLSLWVQIPHMLPPKLKDAKQKADNWGARTCSRHTWSSVGWI